MDKQSADILRRAKALIDRPEKWLWGDGASGLTGNRYCVGCAIHVAHGEAHINYKDIPAFQFFNRVLAYDGPPCGWSIKTFSFNANPSTTHADVMAAFDRAIALAEGRISDEAYTARFINEVVESVKSQEVATAK